MTSLRIDNHDLHLLPGRAVWRAGMRTLYVADLHIGKASAFASGGVPISGRVLEQSTAADLARLTALIVATGAARLMILGDLLHASTGRDAVTLGSLAAWRRSHGGVDVVLLRGNHDRAAGDPPAEAGIRCVDAPFDDAGLVLLHHPLAAPSGKATLAGHLHPAVRVSTAGDQARAACFWLSGGQLVLPAFGGFTGRACVSPQAGDRVFALAGESVVEIPVVVAGARPVWMAR